MNVARWLTALILVASLSALTGCEQEGPAERAGENIDETVDEVGESIEESGEELEEEAG